METIKELLENRKAILKGAISDDKACFNDPFVGQHMRGRVSVEERWLEEVEKLLDIVDRA